MDLHENPLTRVPRSLIRSWRNLEAAKMYSGRWCAQMMEYYTAQSRALRPREDLEEGSQREKPTRWTTAAAWRAGEGRGQWLPGASRAEGGGRRGSTEGRSDCEILGTLTADACPSCGRIYRRRNTMSNPRVDTSTVQAAPRRAGWPWGGSAWEGPGAGARRRWAGLFPLSANPKRLQKIKMIKTEELDYGKE